jgi:hypothetical protein
VLTLPKEKFEVLRLREGEDVSLDAEFARQVAEFIEAY